ncbi:MAG: hypothetical protein HKN16_12025 [Saprospiraceae bacterium]|nr:hypothetical protein [Saprospiraceae bacterium]
MSKIVLSVLTIAVVLGISAVSLKQFEIGKKSNLAIESQSLKIEELEQNLFDHDEELALMEEEIFMLEEQLKWTQDSLKRSQQAYEVLEKKYENQELRLKKMQGRYATLKYKYSKLQATIKHASAANQVEVAQVTELKEKKREVLQEMVAIKKELNKETVQPSEAPVKEKPITRAISYEVTKGVANFDDRVLVTEANLKSLSLRKKRFGKNLSKIGQRADWKYTVFTVTLENEVPEILFGQKFKAKVINMDSGQVLSYVESNPNFPNSALDSKGIGFDFDGNPVDLVYYNGDIKHGQNYVMVLYHVDSRGVERKLASANFPIVRKGKALNQ